MTNITFLVRDRFNLTRQTLDSFGECGNKEKMIVTILDDRSGTPTREFVECWCSDHNAAYIRNDIPLGTGMLRNTVIESSGPRGEYLYISDNDLCFTPNWLDTLIRCYRAGFSSGVLVLGAYNHPFHQPTPIVQCGAEFVCEVNALSTQSQLMRWNVWDQYGPFCDTPVDRVCMSEDVDLCNRITKDGYRVGVVRPALIVSTGITNTFGEKIPGWELVKAQCPQGVICE